MSRWGEGGMSLPEVLAALLLIGIALVSLLQLYPTAIEADHASEATTILSAAAVRRLEENIAIVRRPSGGSPNGSAACADVPNCLLVWTTADELTSATPGVGALKTLQVVACQDTNASATCDAGEPQVRYDTKATTRP